MGKKKLDSKRKSKLPRGYTTHHLLYQKRHWRFGTCGKVDIAEKLRSHPYLNIPIPAPLHTRLHSEIHDIPVVSRRECERALNLLNKLTKLGLVRNDDDITKRLDILSVLWRHTHPITMMMLQWQKALVVAYRQQKGKVPTGATQIYCPHPLASTHGHSKALQIAAAEAAQPETMHTGDPKKNKRPPKSVGKSSNWGGKKHHGANYLPQSHSKVQKRTHEYNRAMRR